MTTLYLDRRDTRLKLDGRALVIFVDEQRRGTAPINLLDAVIMRSAVMLESSLLANLADAGVRRPRCSRSSGGRLGPAPGSA